MNLFRSMIRRGIEIATLCIGYGLFLVFPILTDVTSPSSRKYLCEYASRGYVWPMRLGWVLFSGGVASILVRKALPRSLVLVNVLFALMFMLFLDVTSEDERMLLLHQFPLAMNAFFTIVLFTISSIRSDANTTFVMLSWLFASALFLYGFDTTYYPRHYLLLQCVNITCTLLLSIETTLT